MILSCDNVYAMIGQKQGILFGTYFLKSYNRIQGGVLGFIQRTIGRCAHHLWFERTQAKDRTLVRKALKEHIEDPSKMPILIFPEGTCVSFFFYFA
jgi:glycerol-3-phosphate O-acyltransferase 3/4